MTNGVMTVNTDRSVTEINQDINSIIETADNIIRKQYLTELKEAHVVPVSSELLNIKTGKNVRLFKITSLAYNQTDDVYGKITDIYNAVSEFNSSQILILDSNGYAMDLYMGISSNDAEKISLHFDTFKGSFSGNFPGGKIAMLNTTKNEELLNGIFNEENIKISAVSALTTADNTNSNAVYGIEKLVDGMHGKPFTMVLISNAVAKSNIRSLRQNLEAMHTQLSPYREYSLVMNTNESESYTKSYNLTKSESVTEGRSVTQNTSIGKSKTHSETDSKNPNEQKDKAKNQLIGTAAALIGVITGLTGVPIAGGANVLQGLFYGGSISNVMNSAQTLIRGDMSTGTKSDTEGENYSLSFSEGETTSKQKGFSSSKGLSNCSTSANGRSLQMCYQNKSIDNLLDVIDKQISRLQHIEEIGGFECATYFVTGDNTTAISVANMYRSLLSAGNSLGQSNAINVWSDSTSVERIGEYLKRLNHPVFHFENKPGYPVFNAGSLVATDEFPMYASLPQKSLGGLPVSIHADFARDVIRMNNDMSDQIEIGNIYHMGKTESNKVYLSKNDLSGHMFVSGSTGMGKSNFCYGLLESLHRENIKFMVIEPAKGEYHKVFGGCEDVRTFGTNPNLMPLLKINPFSFPEGVHVNEHINRLLEIFNSCWPMYAAMPAVLKEGMETIYKQCGYNLITGRCSMAKKRFPEFSDLLKVLPEIIKKSEFSSEVKGNYIGSLITRVKSLTDGLYGCIFTSDEIDNKILFDENVLIDLSRVGSGETKALIMGIMVMKLQEYRSNGRMEAPLSHVTVLEEAHHLLRANTSFSAEGVNLRALSLEMITNAIAEMRTYGEGFIIADQSPSLMDLSVIRNTNTKVVFKLPENADRQSVGNAMSLTDEQIKEISKLERGVAVIYQSNWDNAVLSKIKYFDKSRFKAFVYKPTVPDFDLKDICSQCIAILLTNRLPEGNISSRDSTLCLYILQERAYADKAYEQYIDLIADDILGRNMPLSFSCLCKYIDDIINTRKLFEYCGSFESLQDWETKAKQYIGNIVNVSDGEMKELIALCINIRSNDSPEIKKLYFKYFASCNRTKNAL